MQLSKFANIPYLALVFAAFVLYKAYNLVEHPALAEATVYFWTYILPILILVAICWPILFIIQNNLSLGKIVKLRIVTLIPIYMGLVILLILTKGYFNHQIALNEFGGISSLVTLRVLLISIYLGINTLVLYVSGKRVVQLLKLQLPNATQILISVGLGLIIFSYGLLILSLIGKLQGLNIGILMLIMSAFGLTYLKDIKKIWEFEIIIKDKINFGSCSFWLLSLIALQSIISFVLLMAPAPLAFDSLSYYFNLAKELGTTGKYVFGQYPMPIELLFGSGFAITKSLGMTEISELVTMHWEWWAGIFGFISIIILGKKIANTKVGIIAASLYYTMPILGFFMSLESKPEPFVAPFIALTLLILYEYLLKPSKRLIFITTILLWFAFCIKITSIFAIGAFAVAIIIYFLLKKQSKQLLWVVLFCILSMLIVAGPWFVLHVWEKNMSVSDVINSIRNKEYHSTFIVGRNQSLWRKEISYLNLTNRGMATGYEEDYSRYQRQQITKGSWEKFLTFLNIPWNVSVVELMPNLYFMINPFYLAALIALLWYIAQLFKHNKNIQKVTYIKLLALITFCYMGLWWIWGLSVVWYGIGLFVPLGLLVAMAWEKQFENRGKLLIICSELLLIITIVIGVYIQLSRFGNRAVLGYAVGKISKQEAMRQLTGGYTDFANIINNDIQIQSGEKYVMLSGCYLHYFIKNYYQNVLPDTWLDNINAVLVSSGGDNDKALAILRELGVKYIVTSVGIKSSDSTPTKSLTRKYDSFMEFATRKLVLVSYNQEKGVMLLQVP